MSTLAKRKSTNKNVSPWSNRFRSPWSNDLLFSLRDNFFSPDFMKLDSMFNDEFFKKETQMPAMNVKENEKNFEIEFAIPGFSKEDFEVSVENDVLQVSAEKKEEKEEKDEEKYSRKEFSYQSFKRSISIPDSVDLDENVEANYENGILKLKLIKGEEDDETTVKKVIKVN
jgi:HSP20 family protein